MSNEKKKYICKLSTNGYNAGDEAFLTDQEVANFNGGEPKPRFVLAEEVGAAEVPSETETTPEATPETPETPADPQPETPAAPTPGGEYPADEQKPEDTTPPADAPESTPETTPPSTEGVQ
jgi:hypothetical protein